MIITYHIDEIDEVAARVLAFAKAKHIIFNAPMGSGKTTLIKAMCKQLGVIESEISSPTFSLVNEYLGTDCSVYHFDLYRIEDQQELLQIGIEEYLDSNHYLFIEWPEHIISHLDDYLNVSISEQTTSERTIHLTHH